MYHSNKGGTSTYTRHIIDGNSLFFPEVLSGGDSVNLLLRLPHSQLHFTERVSIIFMENKTVKKIRRKADYSLIPDI